MFTNIFWSICYIFFLFQHITAILDGDAVEWLRHAYLVKV